MVDNDGSRINASAGSVQQPEHLKAGQSSGVDGNGRLVSVGEGAEPAAKNTLANLGHWAVQKISLFLRAVAFEAGIYTPSLANLSELGGIEERAQAIGAYLLECHELKVEPKALTGDFNELIDGVELKTIALALGGLDTSKADDATKMGILALKYFYTSPQTGLIPSPSRFFVETANLYMAQKPGEKISGKGIEHFLLENIDSIPGANAPTQTGLTPKEVLGLRILGDYLAPVNLPPNFSEMQPNAQKIMMERPRRIYIARHPKEAAFLKKFLQENYNNERVNDILYNTKKNESIISEQGVKASASVLFSKLSYRSEAVDIVRPIREKLESSFEKLEAGASLDADEKLTLQEAEMLIRFSGLNVDTLNGLALLEGKEGGVLSELKSEQAAIASLLKNVEGRILGERKFSCGNIMQNIQSRKNDMYALNSFSDRVNTFMYGLVTDSDHSAKVVVDKEGNVSLSKVWLQFDQGGLGLDNLLVSDFYKVNPDALIDSKYHDQLVEKYGDNWKEVLQEKYQAIELDINANKENPKFSGKNIVWSLWRALSAGIADFLPGGHRRSEDRDYGKIHGKVMEGKYNTEGTEMICSEYSAKVTIAALYELNLQIKEELGLAKDTPDIIRMPFDSRERIKRIHPDRLIQILSTEGCLEQIDRSPTEEALFVIS